MKKMKNMVAWMLVGTLCVQLGLGGITTTATAQETNGASKQSLREVDATTDKEIKELTLEDGKSTWLYMVNEDGTLTVGSFQYRDEELEEEQEKNLVIPESLTIPVTVDGEEKLEERKVTKVGFVDAGLDDSDSWKRYLGTVTIPAGVTKINKAAFLSCTNLKAVTFEEAENAAELFVGEEAFCDCQELAEIVLPDRTRSLGERAFYGCGKLTKAVVPEGVTVLNEWTFKWCNSLKEVTLPSAGLKEIKESAFCQCDNLEEIVIPEGVETIGSQAFFECISLKKVTFPDTLTKMDDSAFANCRKLESVDLPDSLKLLEDSTFSDCTSLASVTLPTSLETIDGSAFRGCSSLTGITFPEGLLTIGDESFMECTALTSIQIPDSVKYLGFSAFSGCSELSEIILSEGIQNVELKTFSDCSKLTSVSLPQQLQEIRSEAFANCTGLSVLSIPVSVTSIDNEAFSGRSESFTIHTARGSYAGQYAISHGIPVVFTSCLHVNRGVRNVTPATCTTAGYTGDDYCVDCDAELKKGSVETAKGHQWNGGVVTKEATAFEDGEKTYTCNACGETRTEVIEATGVNKGLQVTDEETSAIYKVTNVSKKTVEYVKPIKTSVTKAVIPATITLGGVTYKVTGIASKAFRNCKKLKSITIKTTKLTAKSVGSKAFSGIAAKAVIKVPKSKVKAYKKILKNKGVGKKVTIKK